MQRPNDRSKRHDVLGHDKGNSSTVVCCFGAVEEDSTPIVCIVLNEEAVDLRTYAIVSTSSLTGNTSLRSDLLTFDHTSREDRWEFAW